MVDGFLNDCTHTDGKVVLQALSTIHIFFRNRLLNLQLDGEINRFILYVESCLIHEFNLKFNWKRKVTSIQQFKPNRKFQTPPETTPASSKKGILTCI